MGKGRVRRPLFDGTTWLLALWALALAVGIAAGFITMGDVPEEAGPGQSAQAARDFMVGAAPFLIVSGIALVAGIALDDLTVQLGRRDDD
jgi:hypothetical protein